MLPTTALDWRTLLPPNLPALLPETRQAVRQWARRHASRLADGPALPPAAGFPYRDLPPSAQLRYELVSWVNFPTYLTLFGADPSPFVDARFKQRAALEAYVVQLFTEASFSWKRGATDWLIRRRADDQPLGVLHLYDLSRETINGQPAHCAVGYALAAPARRQGYGFEALSHLLTQAAELFGRPEARAISAVENGASEALLRKCGFLLLEERPGYYNQGGTRLWQRQLRQLAAL